MNTNIQMIGTSEQEWLRTLLTDREQTVERVLTAIEPISKVSSGLDGGYLERLFAHTSKALKSSLGRQIVDLNPLECGVGTTKNRHTLSTSWPRR